jgi:hypothetical protein
MGSRGGALLHENTPAAWRTIPIGLDDPPGQQVVVALQQSLINVARSSSATERERGHKINGLLVDVRSPHPCSTSTSQRLAEKRNDDAALGHTRRKATSAT